MPRCTHACSIALDLVAQTNAFIAQMQAQLQAQLQTPQQPAAQQPPQDPAAQQSPGPASLIRRFNFGKD